jgi:hypothetical protein
MSEHVYEQMFCPWVAQHMFKTKLLGTHVKSFQVVRYLWEAVSVAQW